MVVGKELSIGPLSENGEDSSRKHLPQQAPLKYRPEELAQTYWLWGDNKVISPSCGMFMNSSLSSALKVSHEFQRN